MAKVNGLEGIVAAETDISLVDGENGHLVYRGYLAKELAGSKSFEEVAHLLWYGHLPNEYELENITGLLRSYRFVPAPVLRVIDALPMEMDMMSVLRTAVSALGFDSSWPPTPSQAIQYTALLPTIVAYQYARLRGLKPAEPDLTLSHVENYLYMLSDGESPPYDHIRALEAYLILTMEHGMNASTFAARVVASTQSDIASSLSAAIGAMKGPLHGGAPSEVMMMLEDIQTPENAEPWLRKELSEGKRLMGFGHRVYKTRDPRAVALRTVIENMPEKDSWFNLTVLVEDAAIQLLEEYKPGRRLYTNVEYWAAAILRTVQIPKELYTATFTVSRFVGWTAHVLEHATHNRLIRPQSVYVGQMPDKF